MLVAMLDTAVVSCPYCGEPVELAIDTSPGSHAYVKDCHVCCQPMDVAVTVDAAGGFDVVARAADA
jgi:hypothetical protein